MHHVNSSGDLVSFNGYEGQLREKETISLFLEYFQRDSLITASFREWGVDAISIIFHTNFYSEKFYILFFIFNLATRCLSFYITNETIFNSDIFTLKFAWLK